MAGAVGLDCSPGVIFLNRSRAADGEGDGATAAPQTVCALLYRQVNEVLNRYLPASPMLGDSAAARAGGAEKSGGGNSGPGGAWREKDCFDNSSSSV